MGYWNETCMISGLPISGGDPVVMVILTKSEFTSFYLLAINPSKYITFILEGSYDDYGWIEEVKQDDDVYGEEANLRTIFAHKKAWKMALDYEKDGEDVDLLIVKSNIHEIREGSDLIRINKGLPLLWIEKLKEFRVILTICCLSRISVCSVLEFKGCQSQYTGLRKRLQSLLP